MADSYKDVAGDAEEVDPNRALISKLERNLAYYKRQAETWEREAHSLNETLRFVHDLQSAPAQPPKWTNPRGKRKARATAVAILSDMHFDEKVRPEEVDHYNAYDRKIATLRLETWAKKLVELTDRLEGHEWDGLVVMLGGDSFSGDIHEELAKTNDALSMIETSHYWRDQMTAALECVAEAFPKVHVVAVPGNHGRLTRKPIAKARAFNNWDWNLAMELRREFRRNNRFTFDVPEAADAHVEIYGWHHHLTHGDQVHGGGGIGGIWPPIMRLRARKSERTKIDTLWMGHWHQYHSAPYLVVNGSLKGYDEYAYVSNFKPEPPQQAFAVVTPEHNITWQAPIFVGDRKAEGW